MSPRKTNSLTTRQALRLTALIMAHGLGVAYGQETNLPAATTAASTNTTNVLPPVVVTGFQQPGDYKPVAIPLPKFTEPVLNTPQTVTVVPRQVMDDENTTSLRDALRNVAGISLAAGEGGAQGDNLTLRGFSARTDIFLDGMRDFGDYNRDPFNLEEVDVLKGPESVMFGRGSTGGIVNQVSKMPEPTPFIAGTLALGTDLTRRATADINEPIPAFGAGAAFRFNMMGDEADVADRNVTSSSRFGFAPTLALGLGTPTRLTVSYYHETEDDVPDYGIPWLFNRPAPVPRQNFYGFKSDYFKADADIATVKLEHEFDNDITVRDQVRYAVYSRNLLATGPRIAGTPTPTTPLEDITVNRSMVALNSDETFLENQLDATTKFDTGFIKHTLVAGIEAGRETSNPSTLTYSGVPTTPLLMPQENQNFSGTGTVTANVRVSATSVGLYAVDTLKLSPQWELMGGARWDYFDASYANSVGPLAFEQVVEKPTWRAAIIYKPVPNGSIYFDAGTSFDPSAESLSLTAATAKTPPEENETYEVGTKWDLFHNRLFVGAALFRTEKSNAREPDPNNPATDVLAGDERVNGAELQVAGRITDYWQVFGTYAYLNSEVVSSKFYPAAVGFPLANVPKNSFTLWTTYTLPWRFEIGVGGQYVGWRTASSTAPLDSEGQLIAAPGYWKLDAMLKYRLTKNIDLQVNVYNLTDNAYYDQLYTRQVVPGAGRSALFSTSFKF